MNKIIPITAEENKAGDALREVVRRGLARYKKKNPENFAKLAHIILFDAILQMMVQEICVSADTMTEAVDLARATGDLLEEACRQNFGSIWEEKQQWRGGR